MERRGEQRLAEGDLTFDKTTPWTSAANNRPRSRRELVERHNSQTYDAPPLGPPTSAATPGPPVPLLAGGTERLRGMATSGYHRLRSPGAGAAPSSPWAPTAGSHVRRALAARRTGRETGS